VGEEDSSTPPAAAQLIGELIPGAQVEVIVGVSHMAPIEAPEAVNHLIDVFLSSFSARTTGG
jgi:3-oxoadipate enol-lactonase